ncbi:MULTISPECIES: ACT domain-containing protein [unclassified Clostridioides]|uniref:ACT domain-containing protein n=1 Tax=unclassified Clostridioides TaxID=2635829 RepID=UPI001D112869|nr:ACT domain-containing protein [Clostridioides sp. ZZV14-6154]MCC0667772.1 ACT domain-containing protein [Clostridioides sp. ZZV14-6153]MCC0719004.1 ACT domain-containing protein [Clostridioides sp. ZZV14-6105]WLD28231.1 ACT domain protein [Clostridioides difficile]
MKLKLFLKEYAVCRLNNNSEIPTWIDTENFYSITKTDDELSIVCSNNNIPSDIKSEKEWRILKILGPLDFSLIGILSKISGLLADNKISIFAISTYDTDYILIKEKDIKNACKILNCNGYEIE